ncbi:WD40 repeat-like protein [Rickenella mellea]|uniref:WD40 repeat-like protein n=1 Tax=Rickenella mellea TaxID=50990 RepID=A0A4R5XE65_9AGAM|nr:WD40 repeat-like protein [Rickenella mellea]
MEDFQPNESRGIPKGRGVPTIHSTAARYRTPYMRGRLGSIAWPRHHSGNLARQPTASSSIIPSSAILPQHGSRFIPQTSTEPITIDGPGPSKRLKFIGTQNVAECERRPAHANLPPKAKSKSKVHSKVHTESFELPPHCWKGATNSKESRREFIEQFIEHFVEAKDAIVLQHMVQDQKLHITYRLPAENYIQQHQVNLTHKPSQTSKDGISNSSRGFQMSQHGNPDEVFTRPPPTSDTQRRILHSVHTPGLSSNPGSGHAISPLDRDHRIGDKFHRNGSSHYTRTPDRFGQLSHPLPTEFISINQTEGSDVERPTRRPTPVQDQQLNATVSYNQPLDHTPSSHFVNTHSLHFNSPRMFRSGIIVVINDEVRAKTTTQPHVLEPSDAAKDVPSPSERSNLVESCKSVTLTSSKAGARANTGTSDLHLLKLQPSRSSPLFNRIFSTNGEITRLPRESSDKARRLLNSYNSRNQYLITMHGSIHRITRSHLSRHFSVRVPPDAGHDRIDDACILNLPGRDIAIIGQSREDSSHPLSITHLDGDKNARFMPLERPSEAEGKMRGVSCACALHQQAVFVTGGYDHIVHLWTLNDTLASATSSTLQIKHSSTVQSLLPLRNKSSQLLSAGADCRVNVWDISSERTVKTLNTSNSVYHLHSMPDVGCVCLEVANLNLQFELHDYRLVPERPVQRFGYHSARFHGRFLKGATNAHLFACGDRNGAIRLWDMRKTNQLLQTITCFPGIKIAQVVFDQSDLVVCAADNSLMRLNQL